MPFLWVGVGGRSELVVPTYYVGRQAHLCESRRVTVNFSLAEKTVIGLFSRTLWPPVTNKSARNPLAPSLP